MTRVQEPVSDELIGRGRGQGGGPVVVVAEEQVQLGVAATALKVADRSHRYRAAPLGVVLGQLVE